MLCSFSIQVFVSLVRFIVLYFVYEMVSRWGHKRRQKRSSEKQNLLCSQVLETGGMAHHAGPHGKTLGWSRGRK